MKEDPKWKHKILGKTWWENRRQTKKKVERTTTKKAQNKLEGEQGSINTEDHTESDLEYRMRKVIKIKQIKRS